jgi:hypothetical protein
VRKIFKLMRGEVTKKWRKLHKEPYTAESQSEVSKAKTFPDFVFMFVVLDKNPYQ